MSARGSRRPEPCGVEDCGSRRFHVGDDGFTYCSRGHQQSERGTIIVEDTGELIQHGKKSRRRDESDVESTVSRGFEGPKALEHYLVCLQLVLRKQLRWLIDVQQLPTELETLVRDFWALHLQRLQGRLSYESDTETETQSQSQLFSSRSEGETSSGTEASGRRRKTQGTKKHAITLLDTLTLCLVGCLLLRVPVTIADISGWVNEGRLLYYRTSTAVPPDMRERLPAEYQGALEPQILMKPEVLHKHMLRTLNAFNTSFGMAVPEINHPLILYRWLRELALPLEVYVATQRLARLLQLDYGWTLNGQREPTLVLRYPEARLMGLMIISAKLLFPMDDIKRYPSCSSDLSTLRLDWRQWMSAESNVENVDKSSAPLRFDKAFAFTEDDCRNASDDRLDEYLDWYQTHVATEHIHESGSAGRDAEFRRAMLRMFPTRDEKAHRHEPLAGTTSAQDKITARLRETQRLLRPKRIVPPSGKRDDVPRSGSFYRRYRRVEELDEVARAFYGKAADVVGLSLDRMVHAVFRLERKLERHEATLRKEAGS